MTACHKKCLLASSHLSICLHVSTHLTLGICHGILYWKQSWKSVRNPNLITTGQNIKQVQDNQQMLKGIVSFFYCMLTMSLSICWLSCTRLWKLLNTTITKISSTLHVPQVHISTVDREVKLHPYGTGSSWDQEIIDVCKQKLTVAYTNTSFNHNNTQVISSQYQQYFIFLFY
jgi:hypothetical protein